MIATRLSLWRQLRAAVLLCWCRWHLACLRAERDSYLDAQAVGPNYLAECAEQERGLTSRIARLECDL